MATNMRDAERNTYSLTPLPRLPPSEPLFTLQPGLALPPPPDLQPFQPLNPQTPTSIGPDLSPPSPKP